MTSSGRRIAAAVVTLLASCCLSLPDGLAADACDRLLKQWIDDFRAAGLAGEKLDAPLRRLAEVEKAYGRQAVEAVDAVFQAAEARKAPRLMEQFLELRSPDEANRIFTTGARFGQDGRKGLARAADFPEWEGVTPGQSAHRLTNANFISDAAKDSTFRDLGQLANSGVPGTEGLFKKAAEQAAGANLGGVYEIQASAMIKRNESTFGRLEEVLVDQRTARNAIDSQSTTHVFQMKSKVDPQAQLTYGPGLDITPTDLANLVDQRLGRQPVLMVSNPVTPELQAACQVQGIQIVLFEPVR